jgi:PKD repeat protein
MKWVVTLAFLAASPALAAAQGIVIVDDGADPAQEVQFQAETDRFTAFVSVFNEVPTLLEWGVGDNPNGPNLLAYAPVPVTGGVQTATGLTIPPGTRCYSFARATFPTAGVVVDASDGAWITGVPIVAATSGTAPFPAVFRLTVPGLPTSPPIEYAWDVNADTFSEAPFSPESVNPTTGDLTYLYLTPGTYEARVRVRYGGGTPPPDDSQSFVITVLPAANPPSAGVTASPSASGPAPLTVTFTATATSSSGVSAYLWDFNNDGAPDAASDSSPSVTHTFTQFGFATVTVTVVDGLGVATTASLIVDVLAPLAGDFPSISAITVPSISAPPNMGSKFVFDVSASPGAMGSIAKYEWDFDNDGEIDAITTANNIQWQLLKPGLLIARVVVTDDEGLSATGYSATYEVLYGATIPRCWIAAPQDGAVVWGDFISVIADVVPDNLVASVAFEYGPTAGGPWTLIGTSTPADGQFGVHWDVTGLAVGPTWYVRAVTTFTDASTATSPVILVTVNSVNPTEEEFSGSPFTRVRTSGVLPGLTAVSGITGSISFLLPAGAASTGTYQNWRTERRGTNPHPVEGNLQARRFLPTTHRRVNFGTATTTTASLSRPARVSVYLQQDLSGGFLPDGTDLSTAQFQVMRFSPARQRWEPLLGQTTDPTRALLRATLVATGDLAVAVISSRAPVASSGVPCGTLGIEVLLPLALLALKRRRA